MSDIMPGDLVTHRHSDRFGVGVVLRTWYAEELMAEVKWSVRPKGGPALFQDIRCVRLKILTEES